MPSSSKLYTDFGMAYLHLTIVKVNEMTHISTVNILKMTIVRANVTISVKFEVIYELSIDIFSFDLGPF